MIWTQIRKKKKEKEERGKKNKRKYTKQNSD